MVATRARRPRRQAAWLCLCALVACVVALPAMHVVVHIAERLAVDAPRSRIVVHLHQHCHGGACHDDDDEHGSNPKPSPPHHHGGDRDGEHGRGSPEHLAVLVLQAVAPSLPPRVEPAVIIERTVAPRLVVVTPIRSCAIRAPPRAQT